MGESMRTSTRKAIEEVASKDGSHLNYAIARGHISESDLEQIIEIARPHILENHEVILDSLLGVLKSFRERADSEGRTPEAEVLDEIFNITEELRKL